MPHHPSRLLAPRSSSLDPCLRVAPPKPRFSVVPFRRAPQVLLRDALRRDEGSAPEGYTLGELLVLARSAHSSQRSLALALTAELMALARPRPEDWTLAAPPGSRAAGGLVCVCVYGVGRVRVHGGVAC